VLHQLVWEKGKLTLTCEAILTTPA
jgi:hypothetical protein